MVIPNDKKVDPDDSINSSIDKGKAKAVVAAYKSNKHKLTPQERVAMKAKIVKAITKKGKMP